MKITTVMISTINPKELAKFWAGLLNTETESDYGSYLWLRAGSGDVKIGFRKVEKREESSNIHIDILVDDKDKVLANIEKLGGKLVSKQGINYIVEDTDGNTFDIYTEGEE